MKLRITVELIRETADEKRPDSVYIQGTLRHMGLGDYFALRTECHRRYSWDIANAERIRQLDIWSIPNQ